MSNRSDYDLFPIHKVETIETNVALDDSDITRLDDLVEDEYLDIEFPELGRKIKSFHMAA